MVRTNYDYRPLNIAGQHDALGALGGLTRYDSMDDVGTMGRHTGLQSPLLQPTLDAAPPPQKFRTSWLDCGRASLLPACYTLSVSWFFGLFAYLATNTAGYSTAVQVTSTVGVTIGVAVLVGGLSGLAMAQPAGYAGLGDVEAGLPPLPSPRGYADASRLP